MTDAARGGHLDLRSEAEFASAQRSDTPAADVTEVRNAPTLGTHAGDEVLFEGTELLGSAWGWFVKGGEC